MKKDSRYWKDALSTINHQKKIAHELLVERHGEDFSQPLDEKFREYIEINVNGKIRSTDSWFGIDDTPVKEWYVETVAILENFLGKRNEYLKIFNDNYKRLSGIGISKFSANFSGDFLKSSIVVLEDCILFIEKKVNSLEKIENKNSSDSNRTKLNTSINKSSNNYTLFISRIEEHKDIADKLKEYLEKIFPNNLKVFVANDPSSIQFSQDWFDGIKNGIKQCDLMIILCNPESTIRPWINFEAGAATILDRKIGPICFGGLRPGDLPSPLNYIRLQAIDCSDDDSFNKQFEVLIKIIADGIGVQQPSISLTESEFYRLIRSFKKNEVLIPSLIENAKKYISEKDSVKLFELVNEARLAAFSKISSDAFEINTSTLVSRGINIDDEFIIKRLQEYEDIINPLCHICSTIANFADEKDEKLILSCMENLSYHHDCFQGRIDLKNLEAYPLYLLNTVTGVVALNLGHYNILASVSYKPRILEKDRETGEITKKLLIHELSIFNVTPQDRHKYIFEWDGSKEEIPVWEHVYNHVFHQISNYIPNRWKYLEDLQKLKFLYAMIYIDFNFERPDFNIYQISPYIREIAAIDWVKGRRDSWGKPLKTDFNPIRNFVEEGKKFGNEWNLLKAGFFSGSIERFNECFTSFSSHRDFE